MSQSTAYCARVTHCILDQGTSSAADRYCYCHGVPILYGPGVTMHAHNMRPVAPNCSQISTFHNLPSHFLNIYLNIYHIYICAFQMVYLFKVLQLNSHAHNMHHHTPYNAPYFLAKIYLS